MYVKLLENQTFFLAVYFVIFRLQILKGLQLKIKLIKINLIKIFVVSILCFFCN